ncbi:Protein FAR1-RELATED SEQUENCE 6 [Rhynchospora pubera]|uniref:Protein FAR1-RELATED SEQUENCE n=1 Tax=Rhynchospora pubera TaxID=906938 RepID=A0AAV8CPA9_9POAL|nr:Protein FAR1-RELATED SEQUENCE 6 [Rhynchospora pubera]
MELDDPSSVQIRNPNHAPLNHHDLNSEEIDGDILLAGAENTIAPDNANATDIDEADDSGEDAYDGAPEVGMVFEDHQKVNRFYRRYARRIGFGVSVRRSSFTKEGRCLYLELMCCKGGRPRSEAKFRKRASATTNCPAKIRVKLWADGLLHLELANLDHNHPVSPSMARYLNQYKQLPGAEKRRLRTSAGRVLPPEEPSRMPVDRLGELEELLFGETEHRSFTERGQLRLAPGDAEALRLFFTRMQAKNPSFFSVIDLDEEGGPRGAFWADARSRAAYEYYSDVIYLDTTCLVSKFEVPLVTFLGVNHHGQSVLLGCGLVSDESPESYSWLLKAFIACMAGYLPNALITDDCKNVHSAVTDVLPNVRHRMCLFQIMKRAGDRLSGFAECRLIIKSLQKAVFDSLTPEEFDEEWRRMIEAYNNLHTNDWLRLLYEYRYLWVPVFLKDTFWAGMSATHRNDIVVPFFEGFIDLKTTLKQFLGKYESALQSKYEKEAQADFETFHKRRPAVSKFYMEEQLSKVYTLNMFKLFQDEIEAIMYCHATIIGLDGPISTFEVKECVFLDDGKRTINKIYTVTYDTEGKNVNCICGYFQFKGILCRHALSVFKSQQVHEIPSHFVLDRWKKEFKRLHVLARNSHSTDVVANNRIDRYDYLSMRCLQLAEAGVLSDKYRLALRLIREVEKFLLSDGTHDDTIPRIKSRVLKPKKLMKDGNVNMASIGNQVRNNGQAMQERDPLDPSEKQASDRTDKGQAGLCNGQPSASNQNGTRPSIVYMFPAGFDPQAFGNGSMIPPPPWAYQHMLQFPQMSKQNQHSGQNAAKQTRKRRRINRSQKLVPENQAPNGASAQTSI